MILLRRKECVSEISTYLIIHAWEDNSTEFPELCPEVWIRLNWPMIQVIIIFWKKKTYSSDKSQKETEFSDMMELHVSEGFKGIWWERILGEQGTLVFGTPSPQKEPKQWGRFFILTSMPETMDSGPRRPGFKSWLGHLLAVRLQASSVSAMSLFPHLWNGND